MFFRDPARPDAVLFPPGSPQVLVQWVCNTAEREQEDCSPLQQQSHRTADTEQQQSNPLAQRENGFNSDWGFTRFKCKQHIQLTKSKIHAHDEFIKIYIYF